MNDKFDKLMVAREQEQAVLGALLISNDAIDRIGDLRAEHFYDYQHRQIFNSIVRLIMSTKPADVITVFEFLQSQGWEADLPYLNSLAQNTPSAANIARYAATVREKAVKRALLALARETADTVAESPEDSGVLVDQLTSKLEKLSHAVVKSEPQLARDTLAQHIESIDERYNGGGVAAIPTGLGDLDAILNGGLRRGNLIVLAGRPKMGKTALALNVANNVSKDGVAAVLSQEMTKSELHDRNMASLGRIPLDHLIDPRKLTDEDWPRLTYAVQQLNDMQLYIDDQAGLTLLDVRTKLKQIKRKAGRLDCAVVDYLQLMNGDGDNRNAQIEGITRGLKNLAKELETPIILLSQLNRKLEERPNKRPQPSDLRDSGSIEQDCDVAIFLYRDEVYHPDSPDRGTCEAIVALNRQGAAGTARLAYIGEHTRFENLAQGWRPAEAEKRLPPRRGF
jgi:replicative DNA helicase